MKEAAMSKNAIASTLVVAAASKGGTGKSHAMSVLLDCLVENGVTHAAYDLDDENKSFSLMFPKIVQRVNTAVDEELDKIYLTAYENPNTAVLADTKGGTGDLMSGWMKRLPHEEGNKKGVRLIVILPVTSDIDAAITAIEFAEQLGGNAEHILICNAKDGGNYLGLERTKQGLDYLERFNPLRIDIPVIPSNIMTQLRTARLSIKSFLNNPRQVPNLSNVVAIARVRHHWMDTRKALAPALALIAPWSKYE